MALHQRKKEQVQQYKSLWGIEPYSIRTVPFIAMDGHGNTKHKQTIESKQISNKS